MLPLTELAQKCSHDVSSFQNVLPQGKSIPKQVTKIKTKSKCAPQ